MSGERKKDDSVSSKTSNAATVISTTVRCSKEKEEKFHQWMEHCAKLVTPCAHTFKETVKYFLEQCDALPLDKNDRRLKVFQANVVMSCCRDKHEHQASEPLSNIRSKVMNSSPEYFGLDIHGYYLPRTERNAVYYEEAYAEEQESLKCITPNFRSTVHDICFFFEETMPFWQCHGGGHSLMARLMVFRGISQEDIEKRSPRFLGYITTLSEMGELPGII